MSIAPVYAKLASSAARTANYATAYHPHKMRASCSYVYWRSALLHTWSPLEWLHTRYSGSGNYKSSLYMSSSAEHEQYIAASVSLCVVARCGAYRLAMTTMH